MKEVEEGDEKVSRRQPRTAGENRGPQESGRDPWGDSSPTSIMEERVEQRGRAGQTKQSHSWKQLMYWPCVTLSLRFYLKYHSYATEHHINVHN